MVLAVVAVAFAVREGIFAYTHVYEPNARIQAHFTVLSSSINARVDKILVRRGDTVTAGMQLAKMDAAVAALDLETLSADADKERARRDQIDAELAYFRAELAAQADTSRAAISSLQAEYRTAKERHQIAKTNVERVRALLDRSVVSRQRIDEATDALLSVTSDLRDLQTRINAKEKALNELEERKKQERVYVSRMAVVDRNLEKISVLQQQMTQKLSDMHIYAPVDGIINEVYVNDGTYLEDGDQVFLLHQPNEIWVEANVIESDIRHVKVGQPVIVEVDAYPFEQFDGTVRSLGAVTASNIEAGAGRAMDSRDAQRIPVVIDLVAPEKTLWPGMRASVNIVIR